MSADLLATEEGPKAATIQVALTMPFSGIFSGNTHVGEVVLHIADPD